MRIDDLQLVKQIIEAALMASDKPLNKRAIKDLFDELERPEDELVDQALQQLNEETTERGYELKQVASGYRFQVKQDLSRWVGKLWKEKAPRYSRALLETLSLIAYRQPITRGEIEEIRGVAVSTQIVKTLLEREWVKVVGHRDVPGRPAIYATTKQFLDYFNLKSLDQLPPLAEIRDLNTISRELNIELPLDITVSANDGSSDAAESSNRGNAEGFASHAVDIDNEVDTADSSLADETSSQEEIAVFEEWMSDELADDGIDADSVIESACDDEKQVLEAAPTSEHNYKC